MLKKTFKKTKKKLFLSKKNPILSEKNSFLSKKNPFLAKKNPKNFIFARKNRKNFPDPENVLPPLQFFSQKKTKNLNFQTNKCVLLLKKFPELRAESENCLRVIHSAMVKNECLNAFTVGLVKSRSIDGDIIMDQRASEIDSDSE